MQIDPSDNAVTVALRMEIEQLKRENAMLRDERGVWPRDKVLTASISELQDNRMVLCDHSTLNLAASWDVQIDPTYGRAHFIGKTHIGDKHFTMQYFHETADIMSQTTQIYVLGELHKRVLYRLAESISR